MSAHSLIVRTPLEVDCQWQHYQGAGAQLDFRIIRGLGQ
jgi:hypothetical protein